MAAKAKISKVEPIKEPKVDLKGTLEEALESLMKEGGNFSLAKAHGQSFYTANITSQKRHPVTNSPLSCAGAANGSTVREAVVKAFVAMKNNQQGLLEIYKRNAESVDEVISIEAPSA